MWGRIVNNSRSLSRQACSSIRPETEHGPGLAEELVRRLVTLQIAFAHALRQHLRGLEVSEELARLLPARMPRGCGGNTMRRWRSNRKWPACCSKPKKAAGSTHCNGSHWTGTWTNWRTPRAAPRDQEYADAPPVRLFPGCCARILHPAAARDGRPVGLADAPRLDAHWLHASGAEPHRSDLEDPFDNTVHDSR